MEVSVAAWQVWNTDPAGVAAAVDGSVTEEFPWTKLNIETQDLDRAIRFRPAIIVSRDGAHSLERALVCPLSAQPRVSPECVLLNVGRSRSAVVPFVRGVTTSREASELVCIDRSRTRIPVAHRQPILLKLREFVRGDYSDDSAPRAGTLVRAHHGDSSFEGVVVTSVKRPRYSVLLVAHVLPDSKELAAEAESERGLELGLVSMQVSRRTGEIKRVVASVLALRTVLLSQVDVVGRCDAPDTLIRAVSEQFAGVEG